MPVVQWHGDSILQTHASVVAQVMVRDPLQVVRWQLPSQWQQVPAQVASDERDSVSSTILMATGPPQTSSDPTEGSTKSWSRVRLVSRSPIVSGDTWLQLRVEPFSNESDRSIQALARIGITVRPGSSAPIRLKVEDGWNVQSVTATNSGRVIDGPVGGRSNRSIVFWPVADDVVDSQVVLEVVGTRRIASTQSRVTIPESWFLRPESVRNSLLVAVIPPAEMSWSGETALKGNLLGRDSLSDQQLIFFGGAIDDTLLMRPESNACPSLSLRRPSVSVDVDTSIDFQRSGDDVVETLSISSGSPNQLVRQLSVATGQDANRPEYRWRLLSDDKAALPIILPTTDVQRDDQGRYTIELGEGGLRQRLVGTRRYPLDGVGKSRCHRY